MICFFVLEVFVVLVFNGLMQVVMMVMLDDFQVFGVGFVLSEGIVYVVFEIECIEVVVYD